MLSLTELKKLIVEANRQYYGEGRQPVIKKITITDAMYDRWIEELRIRDPKSSLLTTDNEKLSKSKVKLPYYLPSLDKIGPKHNKVDKWSSKYSGPFLVMDKLDGASILLVYKNGKISAFSRGSRGDSRIGGDISYLVPHLNIPAFTKNIAVRGEIVLPKAKFEKYKDVYSNPRSVASAVMVSKNKHKATKDVEVVIHEVIEPASNSPKKDLDIAKKMGFKVVDHHVTNSLSEKYLQDHLKDRRSSSKHDIDGLVIKDDNNHGYTTSGNPKHAIAYKVDSEDNVAITRVKKVQWNESKYKLLIPVLILEPVILLNTRVTKATAHDAKYVIDNNLGAGAIVEITKGGEIIPYINRVIKAAKEIDYPDYDWETEYYWSSDTEVDFALVDDTESTKAKQIVAFLKTLEIENVGYTTVLKLMRHGINDVNDFVNLTVSGLMSIPGFQKTSADKIVSNIQHGLKTATLDKLMYASGKFGYGYGLKKLKVISQVPNILNARTPRDLGTIPGISAASVAAIVKAIPAFVKWLKVHNFTPKSEVKKIGRKLASKTFAFTGFRNKEAEQYIENEGGKVASSVSKTTTALIISDPTFTSTKVEKARESNIPVLTLKEFTKIYMR
jgi:DNA ligase (NAD+)